LRSAWIDVYPRPGKRGGAFCSGGLPSTHPYVLLNHTDDLDSAHTLAHELGHGVHFYLAREQRLLNFGASTPLAETASVFAEILLDDLLLERLSGEERTLLLAERVEDAINTLFRQVMYTFFEKRSLLARKEAALSPEAFQKIWQEEQARLYGESVAWTELDQSAWAGIPHFVHYRFYTYSYALGYLVVLALYGRYREEGEAFVPRYLEVLKAGEKASPKEILAQAGVKLTSEAFFRYGIWGPGGLDKGPPLGENRGMDLVYRPERYPFLTAGLPGVGGVIRLLPQDFQVEEVPAYLPSGEGEHLYLFLEKEGLTTRQVLEFLRDELGIPEKEIGVAGLKDKHALTRQWFSIPKRHEDALCLLENLKGVRLLKADLHTNKLRTGHLKGNRFRILIREAQGGRERAEAILRVLQEKGLPNYYGPQRFGLGA
jgi:hypothetical protein